MEESYQSVSGWTPRNTRSSSRKYVACVGVIALLFSPGVIARAGVTAREPASSAALKSGTVAATGNDVAASQNANPNIKFGKYDTADASAAEFQELPTPVLLTGIDADVLMGRPASPATATQTVPAHALTGGANPGVAPKPVTIPFPTAAHLFLPGAALALYAARKMRPRYRRTYRAA